MNKHLPPLCPLRIPLDWTVRLHELRDINPQTLPPNEPLWELFGQDLLQIEHKNSGILLDVGWYPDTVPTGQFRLVVIRGSDWHVPLVQFRTRSLEKLTMRIEEVLESPPLVMSASTKVEPTLTELVTILESDSNVHESVRAADLLADRHDPNAVHLLLAHLADPRPRVRYAVVDALRRIGDPSTGPALLGRYLLPEPDLETRRLLIRALGAVRHVSAVPVLIQLLQNPDAHQRGAAAWSLGVLEATEALSAIAEAYAAERNRPTRDEIRTVLHQLAHVQARKVRDGN